MEKMERARHIHRIREEYQDAYDRMKWLSTPAAATAEQTRRELIDALFKKPDTPARWEFAGTKLLTHELSPGCALCGQGQWSCLFINGLCNANCFYCPSEQKEKGVPVTSTVEFGRARDYADYVNAFHIGGVGFSGGEPLMTFDRVVDYLKALRNRVASPLHCWMYTNGLLVTDDKLKILRDAGLDEIRFDLSANQYRIEMLEKAVGVIPVVTVEIPAIPEDLDRTRKLVGELADAGVNHLNLHQIRCTAFNQPKLIQRGYTFVHGPGVAVLETELAALALIRHAVEQNIPLPINYCSFTFRRQFQQAGARRRNAVLVKKPWEDITPTGYIRALSLQGEPERVRRIAACFQTEDQTGPTWSLSGKGDNVLFSANLWPMVDFTGLRLKLTYSAAALRPTVTFRYPFKELALNEAKKVVIERDNRHPGIWLEGEDIQQYANEYLHSANGQGRAFPCRLTPKLVGEIDRYERFSQGLTPYY